MNQDLIVTNIDRIKLVGKEEYKEEIITFHHNLKTHELIFNIDEDCLVRFNGVNLHRQPDTVCFLPKGKTQEYVVKRIIHGDCFVIHFDTNIPLSETPFTLKLQNSAVVRNLFKKIFAVWVSKEDGYYFECISLLYKILSELQKQNYMPGNQYSIIRPAIELIQESFLRSKISIPTLAEKCGISEAYLKRLFIKKFGMPPVKYIIQLKINYACDLLRSQQYTVTQVAESCGYSNVYYFSRQFKAFTGVTPSVFLARYKSSK